MAERRAPKHRDHGAGTLYFDDARQRWVAGLTTDDGRRPRRFFVTKTDAQSWLNDALSAQQHGREPIKGHGMTVAAYLDQWLAWRQPEVRDGTYDNYERIVRVHLVPGLGHKSLAKLAASDVKHFLAERASQRLSPSSVRDISRILRMALKTAKDLGLVADNVAMQAPPTRDKRQVRNTEPMTDAELERFLSACSGRSMEYLFTLGAVTGFRKSELLGLQWSDIDFGAGRVHVRRQLVWRGGRPWHFGEPKSEQALRAFPLIAPALAALKAQKARVAALELACPQGVWTDHDLVFPSEIGGPIHPSNVNREQKKLLVLAGLDPTQTVHNLRHGAATLLLEAGVDPRVVMDLCGWSQMSMLLRYQSVRETMIDDAGTKLTAVWAKPAQAAV